MKIILPLLNQILTSLKFLGHVPHLFYRPLKLLLEKNWCGPHSV